MLEFELQTAGSQTAALLCSFCSNVAVSMELPRLCKQTFLTDFWTEAKYVHRNSYASEFEVLIEKLTYRGADKSLARPGRKQDGQHVRDARDFNNIETRAVNKFFLLQGNAPKEIHAILTETLARFLPGRAKDLSAPLYMEENKKFPSNN